MCVHENTGSPAFIELAAIMLARFGLVPITLVDLNDNFSMFVHGDTPICVQRAAHDLRTWHPNRKKRSSYDYGFSRQSVDRIYSEDAASDCLNRLPMIEGRNVPDSLDLEETNPDAVYRRCVENGYVFENDDDAISTLNRMDGEAARAAEQARVADAAPDSDRTEGTGTKRRRRGPDPVDVLLSVLFGVNMVDHEREPESETGGWNVESSRERCTCEDCTAAKKLLDDVVDYVNESKRVLKDNEKYQANKAATAEHLAQLEARMSIDRMDAAVALFAYMNRVDEQLNDKERAVIKFALLALGPIN